METLQFKTNIKCGGCIASVTPYLDNVTNLKSWEVDTATPEKLLTIQGEPGIDEGLIIGTLEKAGYQAEKI
jgi:copper chaperone